MEIGMNVKKAYTYLSDVVEHKQVVPFRRFNGSIGRASQAKAFKETKGGFFGLYLDPGFGCGRVDLEDGFSGLETGIWTMDIRTNTDDQDDGPRSLSDSSPDC